MKRTVIYVLLFIVTLYIIGCVHNGSVTPENNSINNEDVIAQHTDASKYIKVKSVENKTEWRELIQVCHYDPKLRKGEHEIISALGMDIKLELVDFKVNDPEYSYELHNKNGSRTWDITDWAKVTINDDKTILLPYRELVDIEFENNKEISLAAYLIRDDYVYLCVNTNEDYDIDFCETKTDNERESCFITLGYVNGLEYCQEINDSEDKAACEGGARGDDG